MRRRTLLASTAVAAGATAGTPALAACTSTTPPAGPGTSGGSDMDLLVTDAHPLEVNAGRWSSDGTGAHPTGEVTEGSGPALALAADEFADGTVQLDLMLGKGDIAGLVVRADENGSGTQVLLDQGAGRLLVVTGRADGGGDTLAETEIEGGIPTDVRHVLHVEVTGSDLAVRVRIADEEALPTDPVLEANIPAGDAEDDRRFGIVVTAGNAHVQNLVCPGLATALAGAGADPTGLEDLALREGTSARHHRGLLLHGDEVTLEGTLDGAETTVVHLHTELAASDRVGAAARIASVTLADASGAAWATLELDTGTGALRLLGADDVVLAESEMPPRADGTITVELATTGTEALALVDGTHRMGGTLDTTGTVGAQVRIRSDGGLHLTRLRATPWEALRTEFGRGAVSWSAPAAPASDPNGLVYHEGRWHLFHQSEGEWAHAVSEDLVHWHPLPRAISASTTVHAWSGSAVAGPDGVLHAFFTRFRPAEPGGNQTVGEARSTDGGITWEIQDADVVDNPGQDGDQDFRDPKVEFDTEHDHWVMAVSGGDHIRFFVSDDLSVWEHASDFGSEQIRGDDGVWECPDLFRLPIDGTADESAWVLFISTGAVPETDGSTARYWIGDFDGKTFTPRGDASEVRVADVGGDHYAAMSFADAPDGRVVQIGWITDWDYPFSAPTSPFNGSLTVAQDLSLVRRGDDVHLARRPVPELDAAADEAVVSIDGGDGEGVTLEPEGDDPLADVDLTAARVRLRVQVPEDDAAERILLDLRADDDHRTVITLDLDEKRIVLDRGDSGPMDFSAAYAEEFHTLRSGPLTLDEDRVIDLDVVLDESGVIAFAGEGTTVLTGLLMPPPDAGGMRLQAIGGTVRIQELSVHPLRRVLREMHDEQLGEDYLRAEVPNLPRLGEEGQEPTEDFATNLGEWRQTPQARWEITSAGLRGRFDADAQLVATEHAGDGSHLRASVRIIEGASSLLLRATADGRSGIFVNLDPGGARVRVFRMREGEVGEDDEFGEAPLLVGVGHWYRIEAMVDGGDVVVHMDDEELLRVEVAALAEGEDLGEHVGLNVFDGEAHFQDVEVARD